MNRKDVAYVMTGAGAVGFAFTLSQMQGKAWWWSGLIVGSVMVMTLGLIEVAKDPEESKQSLLTIVK